MLHVFDGHTASWALIHALASVLERTDDRALMIGNTADARRAIGAGLTRFDRIPARGNDPRNAKRSIGRFTGEHGPFESINDWTIREPAEMERAFPGATLGRATIRREWEIDDGTLVIGSAHDHPREVDAMRLVYHAAILTVGEVPTVAVIPSGADQLERAARWAWRHGRARWFVVDDRSPLLLRDAVDVSCWQVRAPIPGARTLGMLAASGQPVVAERCGVTGSLSGENVRLCDENSEIGATRALFKDLTRVEASPDPGRLIDALRGSLAGV
ncbi:MAG: hypothetical protein RLN60_02490 [Phycisphaerales bacterium]